MKIIMFWLCHSGILMGKHYLSVVHRGGESEKNTSYDLELIYIKYCKLLAR